MIDVITPLPPAPSRGDQPDVFVERADAFMAALPNFGTQANEAASLFHLTGHWFGQRTADPVVSPLGGPLVAGDAYYNTALTQMRIYSGTVWRGFDIDSAQLAAADGASLIGHGTGTVEDALNNIDGNLNFTTLDTAAPADDADLMILRQGSQNKKISIGTVRGEFATDAVQAQIAAEAARDAALIQAGVYATEALGRAAVADGQAFKVQGDGGDVAAFEYRRTSSEASNLLNAYPSANALVTPGRTTFLLPGKNLFNKFTVTLGKYLTETGVLADNPVYAVSDYIRVTPGETYYANASGMRYTCYFDKNKMVNVGGSDVGTSPFTVPLGISYVRATMFVADLDIFQFENGPTSAYEPFYYRLALSSGVPIVPLASSLPANWLPGENIADAAIASRHLKNKAVTPAKVNFLTLGKNLFNPATVTVGKYITSTGTLVDNAAYDTSDYIAVQGGGIYKFNSTGIRFSCNYDAEKRVVAGGYNGDTSTDTLNIPAGVAFIRIATGHNGSMMQLEYGSVSTSYEAYGFSLMSDDAEMPVRITPRTTTFLPIGKNKFNFATALTGYYMSAGGTVAANPVYAYSAPIPVYTGPYVLNGTSARMVCFFDKLMQVVPGGFDDAPRDRFTVPDGVAFVRMTVPQYGIESVQLERGSVATAFEAYCYQLRAADGVPIRADSSGSAGVPDMEAPVLATTHYTPVGKEVSLYFENIVRDFQAHAGHIGISMSANEETSKETGEARKLLPVVGQVGTAITGSATVVGASFDFTVGAAGKWYQVKVTDPALTTPVNIQNVGDSFTRRLTWTNVINSSAAFAGLTYSGTRTAADASQTISCEGQGGWSMRDYFNVDRGADELSPFMQPGNTGLKYYGPTTFWIRAHIGTDYNADTMRTDIRNSFSASTGRKLAPAVGDVMREGAGYITWDGANWVPLAAEALGGFVFSYARYRAVWGIPRPDILHVLLGTNDFYSADSSSFSGTYALYKSQYEQFIASVKADSPACRIIVGIPVSCARQGEYGTLNTERVKRAMWMLAKNLNADFGEREAEGIYVLDYHSIVHRVYGFDSTPEKPGADYTGADRYKYFSDITHCSAFGFTQMGNAYMGLIQYLRTSIA